MPATLTYPGVYIEELPSGVRTITGVGTSITAFLGRTLKGPTNEPIRIQSWGDFERRFGPLWLDSSLSFAIRQFFQAGGTDAIVVRLFNDGDTSPPPQTRSRASLPVTLPAADTLVLEAADEGSWGDRLTAVVDYLTADPDPSTGTLFNLTLTEKDTDGNTVAVEVHRNVSTDEANSRYLVTVLEQQSALARVYNLSDSRQDETPLDGNDKPIPVAFSGGSDGEELVAEDYQGSQLLKTGIFALEDADLFNLLCIPPPTLSGNTDPAVWSDALTYCKNRRAMLIVDPPAEWVTVEAAVAGVDDPNQLGGLRNKNAALFFPRVHLANPLRKNLLEEFVPCGLVAGVMARIDGSRGVWKAPAGLEATLTGVRKLTLKLTDAQNGQLNPLAVNCLRIMPAAGPVVWGARTLEGSDRLASEWKYLPVRRLALYLEESLYRGTQWVVFEPNDEPLWAQIRLNVGAFMHNLFRQGAFQGSTPRDAYFVKCDRETTTQNDINQGIVNVIIGFAPLKPAEFVVLKLQQIAGQVEG